MHSTIYYVEFFSNVCIKYVVIENTNYADTTESANLGEYQTCNVNFVALERRVDGAPFLHFKVERFAES